MDDPLDNRRPATDAVRRFWAEACAEAGIDPETAYQVWYFGDGEPMATALAELVRDGPKRATTSLAASIDALPETAPELGGYSVVTTFAGEPVVVIRTTRIDTMPFDDVDAAFAWDEGEGDRTLDDWRRAHAAFFERECSALGIAWSGARLVVCERFEKVYPR
jgi:uncharacterized protein YhfF